MLGHNEFKITMLGHLGAVAIDVIALTKRPVDQLGILINLRQQG
jgi:hypothetical protein